MTILFLALVGCYMVAIVCSGRRRAPRVGPRVLTGEETVRTRRQIRYRLTEGFGVEEIAQGMKLPRVVVLNEQALMERERR